LLDDGSLEGKLTVTWTGLEGMWRRQEQRNQDDASRKKFLEDDVKNSIAMGSEVNLPSNRTGRFGHGVHRGVHAESAGIRHLSAGRKVLLPVSLFAANENICLSTPTGYTRFISVSPSRR